MSLSLTDSRVLIVDDNDFNRKSLALLIRRHGIAKIEFAVDGIDGLEKVKSFRPDLILLDVAMPNMDGLEMCRQLRRSVGHSELPILFQTAFDSDEEQVSCFEAGGSDFISKPIKPGECMARVRHQLERRKLFSNLNAFRDRVEKELRHAQAMQLSLLPESWRIQTIADRYCLSLDSHFETSSELGGDFWNVFELDDHRVGFLIVDFAGHGITAAINTFRLHTLIERIPADAQDPSAWLSALNLALKEVLPTGQFATAFYAILDIATNRLRYAGAGAPNPVLCVDGEPTLLDSAGFLLGMSRRAVYKNHEVAFPPGAYLFLYSDALVESPGRHSRPLGHDGVISLVRTAANQTPDAPLTSLVEFFFAEVDRPLRDDLTAIWVQRRRTEPLQDR